MGGQPATDGQVGTPSRGLHRAPSTGPLSLPASRLRASLEELYGEYCRAQARDLLRSVPREAIRPLYRQAVEWAGGSGDGAGEGRRPSEAAAPAGETAASMELLEAYCRHELLPLPPFRVWVEDYLAHREAYLARLDRVPDPARRGEPVDVDLRALEWNGAEWNAVLRIRRVEGGWRGAVAFRKPAGEASTVTGEVFREPTPLAVRERFHRLEETTLRAFLRSSHP